MSALLLRQLLQPACLSCCSAATAAVAAPAAVRSQQHLQSQHQQRRWASSTSSSSSSQEQMSPSGGMQLTPEQQQHLDALRYLIARPLQAAHNAALLAGLTASYRDLAVVMDQMHKRDILGIPRPLVDEPPTPAAAEASSSSDQHQQQQPSLSQQVQDMQGSAAPLVNHSQMFLPVRDLTKLPDELPPPGGWLRHHLQEKYMTRITAHAQLLPNHLEVSYHTGAFIFLWSPMETFYPGLIDITNALRYLQPHFKKPRGPKRSERHKKVRASLGWRRTTPYHQQRVFGAPHVPPSLLQQ